MKYFLSIFCLSLFILSCDSKDQNGFVVNGTATNIPDGTSIYVATLNENNQPIPVDTIQVTDGKFNADLPEVENPNVSFLSVEGVPGSVIFISENEKVSFELKKDSLQYSTVTGGIENKLLYKYIDHLKQSSNRAMQAKMAMQTAFMEKDSAKLAILQTTQKEIQENDQLFKKKTVEENPDHLISAVVISDMISLNVFPTAELKELYNSLSPEIKNSHLGKTVANKLSKMNAVDVGGVAPDFSAPTPTGEEMSLKDVMGKVTIIDFWASWCKPCRIENPNVVRIYNKYHDQGLEIIGVSLDKASQKDRWLKAIEDDKLTWSHVSNLKYWQEPIAATYNVRSIPATFILDENGVIVAKDLRGDALEAKIAQLLAE